jgi:hypothetical protein
MARRMSPPRWAIVQGMAGLAVAAAGLAAPPALAISAGAAKLAPDQSRQLSLDPPDRWVRVCNDTTSTGTVTVTIGEQASRVLLPGWCAESRAGSLALKNDHAGPALITYRAIFPNTFQN